jgi:alpha-galactosidase
MQLPAVPPTSLVALAIAIVAASAPLAAQDVPVTSGATPPPNGFWIDSLDLSRVIGSRPARAGRAAIFVRPQPGAAQPAPPPITLDGTIYEHGLGTTSHGELWVDLGGKGKRFVSTVGIDDGRKTGRGSVSFEVWLDGVKRFESGVIRAGQPARPAVVDLTGARTMILYVDDAGDGTADDVADWAGAAIITEAGAARPVAISPPTDSLPLLARSGSAEPRLNSPRITGATPGRPFLFKIPASGAGPLRFTARNLPAGLTLDGSSGVITGRLREAGRTSVDVTVVGPKGKATGVITIVGEEHALALTPPMGWNSWNVWGGTVDDAKVRAATDALVASGLAAQGYTYVNIDDAWEGPRDENGEITSNAKFPDMKALTDYVHAKGLKIGIYSSPGPRTCQQRYAGSYQHEAQDARTWARWGFDYIKYDWCSYSEVEPNRDSLPGLQRPYRELRTILDNLDRDFVYSLCQYGWGQVWTWGQEVGGDLWRVTGDITDSWASMSTIGFAQTGHEQYAGPGHWNDTDMLVVGKVGWGRELRDSRLTPNEQLTHITLWALQAAPLLIGADLTQLDEFTTNLLGNAEVLAVNQDPLGKAAGRTLRNGRTEVWARSLSDGTMAVGLFNRDLVAQTVSVRWSELGLRGDQRVRDLWRQRDLGPRRDSLSVIVPRHGVMLVKIG